MVWALTAWSLREVQLAMKSSTSSCFFQLWASAQKILVFRLVKRSFSYTEICLPVPTSGGGNDYIPEAYIYININGFRTAPLSETLNTVE